MRTFSSRRASRSSTDSNWATACASSRGRVTGASIGASASGGQARGSDTAGLGGMGGVGDVLGVAREAAARQNALMRIGVRFGGSLASVQAEHLRQRAGSRELGRAAGVSEVAERLAVAGAKGLEGLATAMSSLDGDLAARSNPPPRAGGGTSRAQMIV